MLDTETTTDVLAGVSRSLTGGESGAYVLHLIVDALSSHVDDESFVATVLGSGIAPPELAEAD